jgi:hypothetical protein
VIKDGWNPILALVACLVFLVTESMGQSAGGEKMDMGIAIQS